MKYWFGLPMALIAAGTLFTACGDESVNELVKAESYATAEDLPQCDESYKGYFAVVPSTSQVFVCSVTGADSAKVWKWASVGGSTTVAPVSANLDCKAEELKDKSGFKVVCNGDSLAVIKNGKNGETPKVEAACSVANLEDGSGVRVTCGKESVEIKNGTSAQSTEPGDVTPAKLKDACTVSYAGADMLVYDCGDHGFATNANGVVVPTWKGLSRKPVIAKQASFFDVYRYDDYDYDYGDDDEEDYYAEWDYYGTIQWEGVDADDDNLVAAPGTRVRALPAAETRDNIGGRISRIVGYLDEQTRSVVASAMEKSLRKNYALKGKVSVEAGERSPGLSLEFEDGYIADRSWGGFCLTYSSEKEMDLVLDNTPLLAKLPATGGKEKTINIPWNSFKSKYEGVDGEESLFSSSELYLEGFFNGSVGFYNQYCQQYGACGASFVDIILAIADKEATVENTFGIYEFGAYGKCSGNTITKLKADVALLKKEGTFTDPNDESVIYNTVTIGYDTWFVENQNIIPVAEEVGSSSSDALFSSSEQAQYTCLDGEACERVGYTFDAAQNLCPEGTHVATGNDWMNLIMAVSEKYYVELYGSDVVIPLMSMYRGGSGYAEFAYSVLASQTGWEKGNEGWDLLGFNLTPSINFDGIGGTLFWLGGYNGLVEIGSDGANAIVARNGDLAMDNVTKTVNMGAVRCVVDNEEQYIVSDDPQ